MKQLEVTIMGQSYILGCTEGGEAKLLEAVENVDREMCTIRDAGKVKARERIAVLAALNIAYELAESGRTHAVAPAGSATEGTNARVEALIQRLDALLQDTERSPQS